MFVNRDTAKDNAMDIFVITLGITMCAIAFLQYIYEPQNYRVISLLYYLSIVLKIVVVVGSLFLLLRLKHPQSIVAGILLFGCLLLPEFFPDSLLGLYIKKVNDIFGYFGGLFIYPIWRWQLLTNVKSNTGDKSDDEPIALNLKD